MEPIKITCDSACEIPNDLSQRYRIHAFSLPVRLGEEIFMDGLTVCPEEIYRYREKTGHFPQILPVSEKDYRAYFEKYGAMGYKVLHISSSSHVSRCWENACAAAKGLPYVSVIDSQSLGPGAGQLALLASELAGADYTLQELEDALNVLKEHLDASCILNPKGIRPGNILQRFRTALETHLHISPEFHMKDGRLCFSKMIQGDMETALAAYLQHQLEGKKNIQTDRVLLTYSGLSPELLKKVKARMLQLQDFDQILEVPVTSAVSCCMGRGSLGLSYLTI